MTGRFFCPGEYSGGKRTVFASWNLYWTVFWIKLCLCGRRFSPYLGAAHRDMKKNTYDLFNALICSADGETRKAIAEWLAGTQRFEMFEANNARDALFEQKRRKPDVMIADIEMLRSDRGDFVKKCRANDRYCTLVLFCREEEAAELPELVLFGVSVVLTGAGNEKQKQKNADALIEELEHKRDLAAEIRLLRLETDSYRSVNILKELIQVEDEELSEEARNFKTKEFNGRYITLILILTSGSSLSGAENRIMNMLLKFKYSEFFCLNISRTRELVFMVSNKNPYERNLRALGERMRRNIRLELDCDSTILISIPSQNGVDLLSAYKKFDMLEENRFFLKEGDVLVDRVAYTQKSSADENVETILMQVYEDIRYREFKKAAEGVKRMVSRIEQEGSMSNIYVRHIFIEILSRLSQQSDVMTNYENMEAAKYILTVPDIWSIEESVISILERSEQGKDNISASDSKIVIDKVIAIIRSEYKSTSLTMEYIAKKVFLSPNYLSAMFKRVKGESINSFIKNYRLERARELLKNSNIKVKDIASLVGFASDGYFATVFRNAEGISAKEYREQNFQRY